MSLNVPFYLCYSVVVKKYLKHRHSLQIADCVFFVGVFMKIKYAKHGTTEQDILCPLCRRKINTYRGGSMLIETACKHCNKLIVLNPMEEKLKVREFPPPSSSGQRFY